MIKRLGTGLLILQLALPARAAGVFDVNVVDDGHHMGTAQAYRANDHTMVNATQLCRALKGEPYWYQVSGRVYCSLKGKKVEFLTHKKTAKIGDASVGLDAEVAVKTGQAYVPLGFFLTKQFQDFIGKNVDYTSAAKVLELQSPKKETAKKEEAKTPSPAGGRGQGEGAPSKKHKIKVVVDAGHGGKDPGTTARGLREKDLTLSMARDLAGILKDSGDFDVTLTRDSDVFIPLDRRSDIANQWGADVFVSIHVNFNDSSHERGMEVYFLSEKASNTEAALVAQLENSVLGLQEKKPQDMEAAMILSEMEKTDLINESAMLAGYVAKSVGKKVDIDDRGVKQAQFFVLHWTRSPAILVETAFISNSKDAAKLASQSWRHKMAESIYDGVRTYAKKKDWL